MYIIYSAYVTYIYILYKYTQIGNSCILLYNIYAIMKTILLSCSLQQWFCGNSCSWIYKFVSGCIFGK